MRNYWHALCQLCLGFLLVGKSLSCLLAAVLVFSEGETVVPAVKHTVVLLVFSLL
jgi:hypothetical protein